jgi:hypothetical protein
LVYVTFVKPRVWVVLFTIGCIGNEIGKDRKIILAVGLGLGEEGVGYNILGSQKRCHFTSASRFYGFEEGSTSSLFQGFRI